MAESPADIARSENILTLTGASIALSTIVLFFSSATSSFSFDFGPPVSVLTIVYHGTILILSRRHRNSPDASPYPTMRPAVGLAAFLLLLWFVTISFMLVSLVVLDHPYWWTTRFVVTLWAQFILSVVETGVMLFLVLLCRRARISRQFADTEGPGRIQI